MVQTRSYRTWIEGEGLEVWSDQTADVSCGGWRGRRGKQPGCLGKVGGGGWTFGRMVMSLTGTRNAGGRAGLGPDESQWGPEALVSWQSLSEERLTRQMEEQVRGRHSTLRTVSP